MQNDPASADDARAAADPTTPAARLVALANTLAFEALVAANPATPGATLERLRTSSDPAVRAAVARNPNTPLWALCNLAEEFPQHFLDNPALPFLLLEKPNLATALKPAAVAALMRCEGVPKAILRTLIASTHPGICEVASLHIGIAAETHTAPEMAVAAFVRVTTRLADVGASELHLLPGLFQPWFHELLSELLDASQYRTGRAGLLERFARATDERSVHENVVWYPDATPALLARLASSGREGVRARVAAHPNTPPETLERLAGDHEKAVRLAVARSARTPRHLALLLLKDPDYEVRRAAARNPRQPGRALWRLAVDDDPLIRVAVGDHAHTGAATLWMLGDDPDSGVRGAVARNPTTPGYVLRHLLSDDDPGVRAWLACNPHVPPDVLAQLSRDEDPTVLDAAARHPRLARADRERLAANPAQRVALAANPRLPRALIESLARTDDLEVLRALARHSRTPVALLEQWASSDDTQLRIAVAGNARTPVAQLRQLSCNGNANLQLSLARNPRTPFRVLQYLCHSADVRRLLAIVEHPSFTPQRRTRSYRVWLARQLRYHPEPSLPRLSLFASNFATPKTYHRASVSNAWIERYVIARNPAAPRAVHEALAHDGVLYVREAARATLAASQS